MKKIQNLTSRYEVNKANKLAFGLFANRQYKEAFVAFEQILVNNPNNKDALIGLLLSDSALSFPDNANILFDYYQTLLKTKISKFRAQEQFLNILRSIDEASFNFGAMMKNFEQNRADEIEGILYSDFLAIVKKSSFKEVFESIMFSSKIIFTTKKDFYDFLSKLIAHSYEDIALEYIESLKQNDKGDFLLDELLKKAIDAHKKINKT